MRDFAFFVTVTRFDKIGRFQGPSMNFVHSQKLPEWQFPSSGISTKKPKIWLCQNSGNKLNFYCTLCFRCTWINWYLAGGEVTMIKLIRFSINVHFWGLQFRHVSMICKFICGHKTYCKYLSTGGPSNAQWPESLLVGWNN